jgi:hypothetical protein
MNHYIENIFAYCDRWCKRCPFTAQCIAFVNGEKSTKEELSKQDTENRAFWENVDAALPQAETFIEKTAKKENIDLTVFDDIPKQVKFDLFQRKAVSNDVLKSGRKYEDMVDDWLDKQMENKSIVAVETELGGAYKVNNATLKIGKEELLNGMIDIIVNYQLKLYLKISRAYYSKGISAETDKNANDAEKDANGTVKTLTEMINRSISAWYILFTNMFEGGDNDIYQILLLLTRIKNNLLTDFPGCMDFKRPGLD